MTNTTTYRTYTYIHEGGDASQTHTYRVGEDQTGVETMVWRATRSKNKQNIICRLPPRLVVRDATLRRNTSCTPSPSLMYLLLGGWLCTANTLRRHAHLNFLGSRVCECGIYNEHSHSCTRKGSIMVVAANRSRDAKERELVKLVHLDEVWLWLVHWWKDHSFFGWIGVTQIHATGMIRLYTTSTFCYRCLSWN